MKGVILKRTDSEIKASNGEIYQYPLVVVEVCGGERHFENIVLLKLGYEFKEEKL